jgi:hypothetical protein
MDGFTVALCRAEGCAGSRQSPGALDTALSETTRRCPHGVLVVTGCLMGPTMCRAGGPSSRDRSGRLAVVQPCHASRRPSAPSVLVGPLRDAEDTAELCRWLRSGALRADELPDRLRGYARLLHTAPTN